MKKNRTCGSGENKAKNMEASGLRLLAFILGIIMVVEMILIAGIYWVYDRSNALENKLNLIDIRNIQTDYDLYALIVGNDVAGKVLSNLDITLAGGVICDTSKIMISNIHFGSKGIQLWYDNFEKGNVMTTLANKTKVYQVGENKTAVSADEFCEIIQQK